jgi:hypothetical protein
MQDIHYACNNTQICNKYTQPNIECKKEGCKFCIETELYAADKKDKTSLEW